MYIQANVAVQIPHPRSRSFAALLTSAVDSEPEQKCLCESARIHINPLRTAISCLADDRQLFHTDVGRRIGTESRHAASRAEQ